MRPLGVRWASLGSLVTSVCMGSLCLITLICSVDKCFSPMLGKELFQSVYDSRL